VKNSQTRLCSNFCNGIGACYLVPRGIFRWLSYSERLSLLDLESLELRRLRADLITTCKVIFGLLDVSSNFFVFRDNSVTRGHPYKVMLGHCDNNSQKQFLPRRIANVWNSLPAADV